MYFAAWAIYRRNFMPWEMDLSRISHVNYAFMNVLPDCTVASGDEWADFDKVTEKSYPVADRQ
jgi:chitinase